MILKININEESLSDDREEIRRVLCRAIAQLMARKWKVSDLPQSIPTSEGYAVVTITVQEFENL